MNHENSIQCHVENLENATLNGLNWLFIDIKGDRFGLFVRDYFRHISDSSVREMGLSLLYTKDLPESESTIYTVCVNAMACKFLTCVINMDVSTDIGHEIGHELQRNVLQYRTTAKSALQKIPLVTTPSLRLLQAILSGVSPIKMLSSITGTN